MSNINLIYWLPLDEVESLDKVVVVEKLDASCAQNVKQLTVQADDYYPINSSGHRCTDIDMLLNPDTDARLSNSLSSNFTKVPEPSHAGLSDEQILQGLVPRGMELSDTAALLASSKTAIDEFRSAVDAAANPVPSAAVEPSPVEPSPVDTKTS